MNASASAVRGVARHPVLAFMLISLGIGFATAAIPPIADSEILPFGLPLHGVVLSLGAGLAAFLVTAALSGRAGLADLARRGVRWRVPVRWYLIALLSVPIGATLISLAIYGPQALAAPSGGWPRALAEVAAVFLLQLVRLAVLRPRPVCVVLQRDGEQRATGGDLPCQLRRHNQPALL